MAEEAGPEGVLGHLNHVLVKQLASIRADGDNLSRRLHDLRSAASAASATVTASAALYGARRSPDSNNSNSCTSSSVLRSSKRHRDSLQEDVVKLCSLTKLLAEENARLHSLNSSLEADIRAAMQQVEDLNVERERLQRENAALLLLGADGQNHMRQSKGVQCVGSSEDTPGMLQTEEQADLLRGERREVVEIELQRLAMDFVQRVVKMEDGVLQNRTREPQDAERQEEQQQARCSDMLSYALPAAAFSAALGAIALSIRVSATSTSNRQSP